MIWFQCSWQKTDVWQWQKQICDVWTFLVMRDCLSCLYHHGLLNSCVGVFLVMRDCLSRLYHHGLLNSCVWVFLLMRDCLSRLYHHGLLNSCVWVFLLVRDCFSVISLWVVKFLNTLSVFSCVEISMYVSYSWVAQCSGVYAWVFLAISDCFDVCTIMVCL